MIPLLDFKIINDQSNQSGITIHSPRARDRSSTSLEIIHDPRQGEAAPFSRMTASDSICCRLIRPIQGFPPFNININN